MATWRDMQEASGDGRGRKATTLPRLRLIAAVGDDGRDNTFGPYKSKSSAVNSMRAAQEQGDADGLDGLEYHGPLTDAGLFYFGVSAE